MEAYLQMNQFEMLPLIEKYHPIKLFVKIIVGSICKIAKFKRILTNSDSGGITIIVLHKIGDSIFTTHAIKKVVEYHANKPISIICFPETKLIYQISFPGVEVLTIPHHYFWKGRIATHKAKKILKETNSKIIYDLTGAITSATLIAFSKAENIVGMNLEYFEPLYDKFCPLRKTPHLNDMYMDVVKMVFAVEDNVSYEFPFSVGQTNKVLIHPHAGWKAKEWGLEKYFEVAQKLSSQYEVEVIAEAGSLSEDIKKHIQEKFRLIEAESIENLIEGIKNCAVFIGNDSGPIYIANMLGKPTFTIYGPTNPKYSKPFGEHHVEVHKEVSCSPIHTQYCFTDAGRKCPDYICTRNLTVNEVYIKILDFLSKEKIQKHAV